MTCENLLHFSILWLSFSRFVRVIIGMSASETFSQFQNSNACPDLCNMGGRYEKQFIEIPTAELDTQQNDLAAPTEIKKKHQLWGRRP